MMSNESRHQKDTSTPESDPAMPSGRFRALHTLTRHRRSISSQRLGVWHHVSQHAFQLAGHENRVARLTLLHRTHEPLDRAGHQREHETTDGL